jgi:hypothetical protein
MCKDNHVYAAVIEREVATECLSYPLAVWSAIDKHAVTDGVFDEDRLALADVEHSHGNTSFVVMRQGVPCEDRGKTSQSGEAERGSETLQRKRKVVNWLFWYRAFREPRGEGE